MGFMLAEYLCEDCGVRFESLEERPAPEAITCTRKRPWSRGLYNLDGSEEPLICGGKGERVIGAPMIGAEKPHAVTMAKSDPPPTKRHLDTRGLADGMSTGEWKKKRREMWRDVGREKVKRELG